MYPEEQMQPRVVQTAPLAHGLGKQLRRVLIDEADAIAKQKRLLDINKLEDINERERV